MKKKNLLMFIACLCATITTHAQTFSGGNGTEESPFLISSKADWDALAKSVSSGEEYLSDYFLLTKDLSGVTTTIGRYVLSYMRRSERVFRGTFDGGGHTISVNISFVGSKEKFAWALFECISGATIKNLGVRGQIQISTSIYGSRVIVAGICVEASSSFIINCHNSVNISVSVGRKTEGAILGGICSYSYYTEINHCYNTGDILHSTFGDGLYGDDCEVGGICGNSNGNGQLINCYNTGNISVSATGSSIGGICGTITSIGKIKNCFAANARITAPSKYDSERSKNRVGRICGDGYSRVHDCYASPSMVVNGTPRRSQDATSGDGADGDFEDYKNENF